MNVDSMVCDWCGDSVLVGTEEFIEGREFVGHTYCWDDHVAEVRAARAEARATGDKWEEQEDGSAD
jgi:hypothetical protein